MQSWLHVYACTTLIVPWPGLMAMLDKRIEVDGVSYAIMAEACSEW